MRLTALAVLLGAALMATPATAAWRGYISHPLGFSFSAPGELKVEKGTYRGAVAGARDTLGYSFVDDDIEYKVMVIDMSDKANDAATLLGEAEYIFQEGKKVLMDTFGRVDRQFGRKLTVDQPNNTGRATAAFYFINGRIISLQATVLPANGDYDSPEPARFVDSIAFFTVRAPDDAIELPAPSPLERQLSTISGITSITSASSPTPAQAASKSYINRQLGFSFMAPGEVKTDIGNSRGAIAGPRQSIVYRSVEDNVEYKVTVMSFLQSQAEGATLLGERQYMFQDRKTVLMDTFSRVGSGQDAVYGRKIVVDLPDNKGRTTGAFYFTKGRLISAEATVLPAKGSLTSPDADRFIDSIAFVLSRTGAVELETPKLE
jgi:hypothetical protein